MGAEAGHGGACREKIAMEAVEWELEVGGGSWGPGKED